MSHVSHTLTLHYAGLNLTVVKNDAGVDCVPLKPLSDLFGLQWETQREKVNSEFYKDYLGACVLKTRIAGIAIDSGSALTCTPPRQGADEQLRDHTCIQLDRVAAYLMTLTPAKISSQGNESGAAFLAEKLNEWADALHDYELLGSAVNPNHFANQNQRIKQGEYLMRLMRSRQQVKDPAAQATLTAAISAAAAEMGLPYTPVQCDPVAQSALSL